MSDDVCMRGARADARAYRRAQARRCSSAPARHDRARRRRPRRARRVGRRHHRRVRLGQVHARPPAAGAWTPRRRAPSSSTDERWMPRPPRGRCTGCAARPGIVFQDPYASLDPRMSVGRIVGEPLWALGIEGDRRARVREVLEDVGLEAGDGRPLPARVLRRAAPAHRARPRHRAPPARCWSATSRCRPST